MTLHLTDLSEGVARDLRDPDGKVLDAETLRDLVNGAIADVNKVAPRQIEETITLVANTLDYPTDITHGVLLEVWDNSLTPPRPKAKVQFGGTNPILYSESGWRVWGGNLHIPYGMLSTLDVDDHVLKFQGYGPYPHLHEGTDIFLGSEDLSYAVREHATQAGYERLMADMALFTQWQTLPNNTNVSPTQIAGMADYWARRWSARRKNIAILRLPPQ